MEVVTRLWQQTRPHYTVGVVGVVLNSDRQILIVEHVTHPTVPWGLPGGWVDRAESFPEALARELREEVSLDVEILDILLLEQSKHLPHHIDIAYLCHTTDSIVRLSSELLDYQWSSPETLPILSKFQYKAVQQAFQVNHQLAGVE
jgi:ADP-ribose pyrophosphatase YjhB (NUDIX family)